MKSLILLIATVLVLSFHLANNADAKCMLDKDWPGKPCIDTYPPLPLSKSEWKSLWDAYFDFKGMQWMEQKKSELDEQVKADTLKNWIESGSTEQNFTNYNVWFYYYVNNKAPAPEGYELEEPQGGSSEVSVYPKLGEEFKLEHDEVAFFKSENIQIKFSNVTEDSRCPTGVQCIWQGRVSVNITIVKNDQNKGDFSLTLGDNEKLAIRAFDGFYIKLLEVNPYPAFPSHNIDLDQYVATLFVEVEDQKPIALPPLKQIRLGISVQDVKCRGDLQLVIRERDGLSACVKQTSLNRLYDLHWAKPIDSTGNPGIPKETIGTFVTLKEGDREGPLLVNEIFKDSVSGENFLEYPVARDTGFPITLHLGDIASNGCTIELALVKIEGKSATFLKKENNDRICPICLSEDTVIDTPNGLTNVKDLREGMIIFTQDISGNKIIGTILKTGNTTVSSHKMIHIILSDNRDLYVSPNHPTADGKLVGELSVGDILDGSKIKSTELVPYHGTHTYDILSSGPTGFYWANGILIKSTLT